MTNATTASLSTCKAAWRDGMELGSATNPHATGTPEFKARNLGAHCWSWAETWDAIQEDKE